MMGLMAMAKLKKDEDDGWRETYPPVPLEKDDPRYWPYRAGIKFPGEVHQNPPEGAVLCDGRIRKVSLVDGRYWFLFKYWNYIMEIR